MSQLDALFRQMGVESSKNDTQRQSYTHQQYVQLDSSKPFVTHTSTAIADLEANLFTKYSEVVDDTVQPVKAAKRATSKIGDIKEMMKAPVRTVNQKTTMMKSFIVIPAASKPKRYKSSTDNDLKVLAYDMTRMEMLSCNPSVCKLGGNCVQNCTIADMRNMVKDFWGHFEDPAPSSKTRQLLILSILRSAYRPDSQEFHFYAGSKTSNNRGVCEVGYLILLGISIIHMRVQLQGSGFI
eukprot:gene27919-36780_t